MSSGGEGGSSAHAARRPGIGVFLSAVSSEFATARSLIRSDLAAKQWEVREQSDFVQGGDATTLERLHTYIEGCSTVVCVIGQRAGASPPLKSALPFLTEHADTLPDDFVPSFTQWELIFARAKEKRLLIFHAGGDYEPDRRDPVEGDDPDLQREFVRWIFEDLGLNRGNFSTNDELARLVLREDWTTPAANGLKVRASMTRNGLRGDEDRPRIRVRAAHDRAAPSLSSDTYEMRGRERERERLETYLTRAREQFIEVIGPDGVGKKKLLSQFETAGSVVTDPADLERVEDLVQSAWESLVDPPLGTVLPGARERQLKEVQALVLAADVDSVDQLGILLDAMPRARFCVTAERSIVVGIGEARRLELAPLGPGQERAMLEIFADRYLLPIPADLEADVIEICRSVRGSPACIVQQALAAERADSLEAWVAERRPLTTGELPSDMQAQVPDAVPAVDPATVARAVGEAVPRDVLVDTTSLEATNAAEAGCRIRRGSPRYRVTGEPPVEVETSEVLGSVLERAVAWAGTAGSREILDSRAFVVRMSRWGVDHERWHDVVELGRRCEPALALGGRHGAWQEVLDGVLVAARHLDDESTVGWALHELGSRSLIRDDVPTARTQLAAALRHRRELDPEAADVTRHNLRLVPGAVISLVGLLVTLLLGATWTAAVVTAEDLYDDDGGGSPGPGRAIAEITPEVGRFGPGGARESDPFTILNVGDAPFDVALGQAAHPEVFRIVDPGACPDRLDPDEECRFTVEFTGEARSSGLLVVPLTAEGGVTGDRQILLVAEGVPATSAG